MCSSSCTNTCFSIQCAGSSIINCLQAIWHPLTEQQQATVTLASHPGAQWTSTITITTTTTANTSTTRKAICFCERPAHPPTYTVFIFKHFVFVCAGLQCGGASAAVGLGAQPCSTAATLGGQVQLVLWPWPTLAMCHVPRLWHQPRDIIPLV